MPQVVDQDGPRPGSSSLAPEAGARTGPPGSAEPEWLASPPPAPLEPVPGPRLRRSRAPLAVALAVVAVLAGSGLFVAGFTLGAQHERSPGTSVNDQTRFDSYWQAYHKIVDEYIGTFTDKQLVDGSIKGMFQTLGDPYSLYLSPEEFNSSLSGVSGQFEGIGAQMSALDQKGQTCPVLGTDCFLDVVHVIRRSPAQNAGLLAGDVITAVDESSVVGLTVDQSVDRIRGPRDTAVRLSLLRAGAPMNLSITRGVVQAEDVTSSRLAGGTVGYIKISGFSNSAASDVEDSLRTDLAAGVRQYVVDLRDDPGGLVDAAMGIASQFIGSGPVYWEERAGGVQTAHMATGGGLATDPSIRVAVLVNGGSASASEILAGALHDTGRATLVGARTFGKGTVQQFIQLPNDNGGFRLSIAKWLTPDKTWIHGVGITPDVVVPVPDGTPQGQDPQLARALQILAAPPSNSSAAAPQAPAPSPTPAGQVPFLLPLAA